MAATTLDARSAVAVVGGGIAGLSAAWALLDAAPQARVVVYESDDRLGGKLRSAEIGGRAVDVGPDAFVARRPEALELCRALGLGDELVAPASGVAYVWARRGLRPLPAGLALGVPTRLGPLARSGILSPAGVARAALDLTGVLSPTPATADHAVAEITRSRLGRQVTARLVDPLIGGIHAGDTTRMSAGAVYPPLLDAAAHRSVMRHLRRATPAPSDAPVFLRVRGGMTRLVDALGTALAARGATLRTATSVDRLELSARAGPRTGHDVDGPRWVLHRGPHADTVDAVVVATPAPTAARLLGPVDDALGAALGAIPYATVAIVTMCVAASGVGRALDGTGFLVPAESGRLVTACTWLSAKWPHMAVPGEVLLRASVGRFGDDRHQSMTDAEIAGRVVAELGSFMGLRAAPTETTVTRWPDAFPQYEVGHLDKVAEIERRAAALPRLAVAGAALRGVGIPACIDSGWRAAASLVGDGVAVGQT